MNFIGLDIGGANIKIATLGGSSGQIGFPIWKNKHELASVLATIDTSIPDSSLLGVTMTAELADCFATKQAGVQFIVQCVEHAFAKRRPLYYCTDGSMCGSETAIAQWQKVAASNWHASAWMAFLESSSRSGFVVDIGSTTTDIIPVQDGMPKLSKQTDLDRLANDQLLYAGVGRTPVCSLLAKLELPTKTVNVAREIFATMADVFLWLGEREPDEANCETADGRCSTRANAGQRLARMICADFHEIGPTLVDAIAHQAKASLESLASMAIKRVVSDNGELPKHFRVFGQGAKLAEATLRNLYPDQSTEIVLHGQNELENQTAPALAVAMRRREVELAGARVN